MLVVLVRCCSSPLFTAVRRCCPVPLRSLLSVNMPPRARPPVKKGSTKKPSGPLFPMPFRAGFGVQSTIMSSSSPSSLPVPYQASVLSSSSQTLTPAKHMEDCVSPTTPTPTPSPTPMEDITSRIDTSETSENSQVRRRKRRWNADTWAEYDLYDGDVFEDGIDRVVCKYCKKGPLLADSDLGTSNFSRHTAHCKARLAELDKDGLALKDGEVITKFDQSLYKEMVSRAIIQYAYPFIYAEHQGNRDLHQFLNADCKPIYRNTAKNHVMRIHDREKQRLRHIMMNISGKFCLTSDIWTSVVG